MTIAEYLKIEGITLTQFAGECGTSKGNMSRWANGLGVPNAAMLRRMYEVSGGRITPNDFYPFLEEDSA